MTDKGASYYYCCCCCWCCSQVGFAPHRVFSHRWRGFDPSTQGLTGQHQPSCQASPFLHSQKSIFTSRTGCASPAFEGVNADKTEVWFDPLCFQIGFVAGKQLKLFFFWNFYEKRNFGIKSLKWKKQWFFSSSCFNCRNLAWSRFFFNCNLQRIRAWITNFKSNLISRSVLSKFWFHWGAA